MRVVSDSRLPVDVDRSALICTFHARRAAALFDPGDHHGADDARSLRSGIAADRGAHRLRHRSARPRSRGAGSLDIEPPEQDVGSAAVPLHLLVDSTGLKLGGDGEWSVEKHGTSRRRSWRKLHIGLDGESGEIVAIELTKKRATMPRELLRCSTSSPVPWRPSRLTVHTIRTEFTRRSPSVIRMPSSSCRREQPKSRVRPPRPLRHSGTDTSRRSSSAVGWAGKRRVATICGPRSRPQSVDTNA